MQKAIAFGLLLSIASSAGAQTQIIIRRPGEKDQVIRLDSTRALEMSKRLNSELRTQGMAMQDHAKLFEKTLAATALLKIDTAPMKIALRSADLAATRDQVVSLESRLKSMSVMLRQPRIGIVVDYGPRETDKYGAYVVSVTPGGPADKAGLMSGDIIIRFAGKSLTERDSKSDDESTPGLRLIGLIAKTGAGKPVEVELRRGTQNRTVKLTPVEDESVAVSRQLDLSRDLSGQIALALPRMTATGRVTPAVPSMELFNDPQGAFERGFTYSFSTGGLFGSFELAPMNEKLGSYFGTTEGVLVVNTRTERPVLFRSMQGDAVTRKMQGDAVTSKTQVDTVRVGGRAGAGGMGRGGRADTTYIDGVPVLPRERAAVNIGLEPGDVIVSVDGRKVTTPSQLMRIVATYERGEEFKLQIMRQKRAETLTVKMP